VPPIPLQFRYAAPLLCGKTGSQTFNLSYPLLTIKHLKSLCPVMHFSPDKQDLTILKPRTPPQYTRTDGVITPQPYTAARLSSLHRPTRPPPRAKATINRHRLRAVLSDARVPRLLLLASDEQFTIDEFELSMIYIVCAPSCSVLHPSLPHREAAPFDPYPSSFLRSAGPLTDMRRLPRRF
jgi:hypothetical protein